MGDWAEAMGIEPVSIDDGTKPLRNLEEGCDLGNLVVVEVESD